MIKLVIYDADGVIIKGQKFKDVRNRELSINSTKEAEFFKGVFQKCLVGQADLIEEVKPYLPHFGWHDTAEAFLQFWFTTEHHVDESMVQTIQALRQKNIDVVLATNQEKYRAQYMTDSMGFGKVFNEIYSSASVGHKKPDAAFYKHILNSRQVDAKHTLFWDDDPENIKGAADYGIHSELYTSFKEYLAGLQRYGLLVQTL